MAKIAAGLAMWFGFWACVEILGLSLTILRVLPEHNEVTPFAFAMAVLVVPVGIFLAAIIWALGL